MSFLSCALTPISAVALPAASTWLDASELVRLDGLGSPARRLSFLSGRWQARCLVAQRRGSDPVDVALAIDPQGRSRIPDAPELHLSISHTGDWVACAMANAPVGIDIERLRPRADVLALAATVHSPAQCAALAALQGEAQLLNFYRGWTLKEAWLKRQGLGLDFARMRGLEYGDAGAEPAQALSGVDLERGLVLALDGEALGAEAAPAGFAAVQRLRYVSTQSMPKSK